jgi:hypothetical protein
VPLAVAAVLMVTVLAVELIAVTVVPEAIPAPVTVEPIFTSEVELTDVSV